MTASTTTSVPQPRLFSALIQFRQKSTRERADLVLFVAGLVVEYVLLFALFFQHAGEGGIAAGNVLAMLALCFALAVHQFLIFRNSTLQYALPGTHFEFLELLICLFFGVLTGELGYLFVLTFCAKPHWLHGIPVGWSLAIALAIVLCIALLKVLVEREQNKPLMSREMLAWLAGVLLAVTLVVIYTPADKFAIRSSPNEVTWYFAEAPFDVAAENARVGGDAGKLAMETVEWFVRALGRALKALFALGAAVLSLLILVWDFKARGSFEKSANTASLLGDQQTREQSYELTMVFFFVMDGIATLTWILVLGVVLPHGLVVLSSAECFDWLGKLSFLYAAFAVVRLGFGGRTVRRLSSEEVAAATVI